MKVRISGAAMLPPLMLVFAAPLVAQPCPDAAALARGVAPVLAPVRVLADDAYGGRLAGTPGERCAGDYIAARFEAIGLQPAGTDGYGAWLGTVPDFTPVERGVRLGGITPGSPADAAGLLAGDILIGMAGQQIADLQAMTDVLRAHRPGDMVDLVVLRDDAEFRTRATLGSRSERGG